MVEGRIIEIQGERAYVEVLKNNLGAPIPAWGNEWLPLLKLAEAPQD